MTRSPPWSVDQPFTTGPTQSQQQGVQPKDQRHVGFANPPWKKVTDSWRTNQEHPPNQQQDQAAAAMVAPELPEEDWDDELTLPSRPLDWEQIVDQATTTEGGKGNVDEHPVKTKDGGATAWAMPKSNTWDQDGVPVEPLSEGPGAAVRENVETKTPDGPFSTEPAEERDMMIETEEESEVPRVETVEAANASESPKDTTLKVIDDDAGATQAPHPHQYPTT